MKNTKFNKLSTKRYTLYAILIALLCIILPQAAQAATYYVDAQGTTGGSGTFEDPYHRQGNGIMSIGTAGDIIYLRNGYYGEINYSNGINSDYKTIQAQPGHTPTFKRIKLTSCSKWIFKGLTISPEFAPVFEQYGYGIVDVEGCNDITIEDNNIFSVQDASSWTANNWKSLASSGIHAESGTNIIIRNNTIKNVNYGIHLLWGGSNLIEQNKVEYNIGDGIQVCAASNITIKHNILKNFYDVSGTHVDGIQFYGPSIGQPPCNNINIIGNIIIHHDPNVTNLIGTMHGIGCFDGPYDNWLVENNVVSVDHLHGIAIYKATNSKIINNIVFYDPNEAVYPSEIHTGGTGNNVVIRNNMAHVIDTSGTNITADHNIDVDNYSFSVLFADWQNNDLRHKLGSPAIDAGSADLAPNKDIEGTPRPQGSGYDIGAYEYTISDPTPPSTPQDLTAQAISEQRIDLSWQESTDPESGISYYKIYRDGSFITTSVSSSYSDTGLNNETTYSYEVSAVNGQGLESGRSNTAQVTTLTDTTPPSILSVSASETSVEITFSESLDTISAEQTNNYSINNGISITAASLDADKVTLTTLAHTEGSYTLTVVGVQDIAGNSMSETTIDYEYSEGLVGYWKFDDGSGSSAVDSSGNSNTGTLINGPTWTTGKIDGALSFDGVDDAVEVPTTNFNASQGTLTLWAYARAFSDSHHFLFGHTTQPAYANRIQLYTDDINGNLDLGLGNSHTTATNIQTLNTLIWYHIALTWDGTVYTVYVDGQPKATGTYSGLATISNSAEIGNNGRSSTLTEPFNGILDEVRLYNRALTAAEVLELYNNVNIIYGDVSGDAEISAYDAALTAQAAVDLITLTPEQTKAADVSGDGEVSAYDAALIAQKAVGLIDKFPVE